MRTIYCGHLKEPNECEGGYGNRNNKCCFLCSSFLDESGEDGPGCGAITCPLVQGIVKDLNEIEIALIKNGRVKELIKVVKKLGTGPPKGDGHKHA